MSEAADSEQPLRPLTGVQKAMVALGTVAMGAGMTINYVVVAPLARQAGLTEIQVASILTLSTFLFTLTIPRWGRLADRFGRKRVMVFSLLAMAGTNMMFLFGLEAALAGAVTGLSAIALLAFLRVFFGLLSPGLQPASMAMMTDASTYKDRAATLGLLGAAMSVGSILGPASAAFLARFGALAPVWGSIAFCALIAIVLAFTLPKSMGNHDGKKQVKPLKVTDPRVLPYLSILFSYFVAVAIVQQTLGWLILDRYELDRAAGVEATGVAFTTWAIGTILVQFLIVQRYKPDPKRVLPLGMAFISLGYAAALWSPNLIILDIAYFIIGCGAALALPAANALTSLSVSRDEQGAAAALAAAAPPGGFIVGPMIGAVLYSVADYLPLMVSAIAVGGLAVVAYVVISKRPLSVSKS